MLSSGHRGLNRSRVVLLLLLLVLLMLRMLLSWAGLRATILELPLVAVLQVRLLLILVLTTKNEHKWVSHDVAMPTQRDSA